MKCTLCENICDDTYCSNCKKTNIFISHTEAQKKYCLRNHHLIKLKFYKFGTGKRYLKTDVIAFANNTKEYQLNNEVICRKIIISEYENTCKALIAKYNYEHNYVTINKYFNLLKIDKPDLNFCISSFRDVFDSSSKHDDSIIQKFVEDIENIYQRKNELIYNGIYKSTYFFSHYYIYGGSEKLSKISNGNIETPYMLSFYLSKHAREYTKLLRVTENKWNIIVESKDNTIKVNLILLARQNTTTGELYCENEFKYHERHDHHDNFTDWYFVTEFNKNTNMFRQYIGYANLYKSMLENNSFYLSLYDTDIYLLKQTYNTECDFPNDLDNAIYRQCLI